MSRREFLRLGGAGLAGMAVLGAAGCGWGGSGSGDLVFAMGVDSSGTLQDLVDKGKFQVRYREMPADTGQFFDQLRTELQAAASEIDVIGGDVIWPAQFAANGWILDVTWVRVRENRAYVSGHISLNPDGSPAGPFGKVGAEVSV